VTQEDPQEEQDTQESQAVEQGPVTFEPPEVATVGDPAAASVDADPGPALVDPVATVGGQSPIEADRRGAAEAEDPPLVPIAGAFVGAFVAAKLLGRLGGGDD
jgi:hypothetical protein